MKSVLALPLTCSTLATRDAAGELGQIQRVVAGAEVDGVAAGVVQHGQHVVGRRAVDVLDVEGGQELVPAARFSVLSPCCRLTVTPLTSLSSVRVSSEPALPPK